MKPQELNDIVQVGGDILDFSFNQTFKKIKPNIDVDLVKSTLKAGMAQSVEYESTYHICKYYLENLNERNVLGQQIGQYKTLVWIQPSLEVIQKLGYNITLKQERDFREARERDPEDEASMKKVVKMEAVEIEFGKYLEIKLFFEKYEVLEYPSIFIEDSGVIHQVGGCYKATKFFEIMPEIIAEVFSLSPQQLLKPEKTIEKDTILFVEFDYSQIDEEGYYDAATASIKTAQKFKKFLENISEYCKPYTNPMNFEVLYFLHDEETTLEKVVKKMCWR